MQSASIYNCTQSFLGEKLGIFIYAKHTVNMVYIIYKNNLLEPTVWFQFWKLKATRYFWLLVEQYPRSMVRDSLNYQCHSAQNVHFEIGITTVFSYDKAHSCLLTLFVIWGDNPCFDLADFCSTNFQVFLIYFYWLIFPKQHIETGLNTTIQVHVRSRNSQKHSFLSFVR